MNNQQAKFILSAYRPNGVDSADETFAEALRQAQRDPALGAWLAHEQALDATMTRKLKEITPPAGLRDAILTGARVSGSKRITRWSQPWWMGLGAAAALLIVVSIAVWPKQASAEGRALTEFALKDNSGSRHGGHGGEEARAFQARLSDPKVRLSKDLGIDFEALRRDGCRTVGFDGHEVLEICFNRDGRWYHLYAVRAPFRTGAARIASVAIVQRDNLSCATWVDSAAGVRFALVTRDGLESLKTLL